MTKAESGHMELEAQPFNLQDCIEDVLDLLAPKAAEKQLELAYISGSDAPHTVIGDVTQLRQILVNLVANGIKFTERGEIVVGLRGEKLPDNTFLLEFSVRDTGIGIPADRMHRLFQSFSQVDSSTTRRFGGTGLGLAISHRLAELMGGKMWVESTPGEGSTFYFTIVAKAAASQKRIIGQSAPTLLHQKRLLIVDDSHTNREILVRQSQAWGIYPVAVESGAAALALLAEDSRFDLAILDMQMPDMDGIDLARAIHNSQEFASIPLLMLTSIGYQELRERQAGVDLAGILTKPVKRAHLFDTLTRILSQNPGNAQEVNSNSAFHTSHVGQLDPSLRILLAEDNPVNQKVALRTLERLGYRADAVSDGVEVLASLQRQVYDVVLMDVQMPILDGLETTIRLRAELPASRQPYVIAMTANAMQGDQERCLAAGMDSYLSKPFKAEELVTVLRHSRTLEEKFNKPFPVDEGPATGGLEIDETEVNGAEIDKPERKRKGNRSTLNLRRFYTQQTSPAPTAQSASPTSDGSIQWDTLEQLQRDLGEEGGAFLNELVEQFLKDTSAHLQNLEQAQRAADLALLHRTAHSVKSIAKVMGADLLSGMCAELEKTTAHPYEPASVTVDQVQAESTDRQVQKIIAEFERVYAALHAADFTKNASNS